MPQHNFHDAYFKSSFSDLEITRDFLEHFLDHESISQLDLSTLELTGNSFIDEHLQEHFSDLVFRCRTKTRKDVFVTLLLEHKSYPDKEIHLQLLRYMINMWEYQKKDKSFKKLQNVIPVVIYHGSEKWHRKKMYDRFYMKGEAFEPFIPHFEYLLSNLNSWKDEAVLALKAGLIRNVVLALKHSRDTEGFIKNMARIISLGNDNTFAELPVGFVRTTTVYLFKYNTPDKEKIMDLIKKAPASTQKEVLTIAEQFIREGESRGMEKGMEKGMEISLRKTVLHANSAGLDIDLIMEITKLPKSKILEILDKKS
ncbi:MAG: Rpn family recombination-promoting nuclease/putative transposase [Bacteroidia bacterium]